MNALAIALALAQAPQWSESDVAKLHTHTPLAAPAPDPTNRVADDERAARLGQRLFFDKRLSANGELACASCHLPERELADGKQVFEGLGRGTRNTPSLWNVAYQRWFFWDGRADSLWAQAAQPIENAIELGGDRAQVARLIASDASLRASYVELFGAPPDVAGLPARSRDATSDEQRRVLARVIANVGKALEAYERKLVRRDAPFDRFVAALDAHDEAAANATLSDSAQRGLRLFLGKGNCRLCHGGPNFSDGEFHNIGVPPLAGVRASDAARYDGIERVQHDELNAASEFSDAREGERALQLRTLVQSPQNFGEYRTPSLRNVALAPPYMHQGQFASLRDVLHFYSTLEGATQVGHHQEQTLKPLQLAPQEIEDLVAFLESLTGVPPPREWLEPPKQ